MYLLAKYFVNDEKISFVAGIIYTFSSYHFIHAAAGHLDIISIQWIPLYILYLIKTVKEASLKNAVLAAVFLAFTALSTWYYMLYLFIFTGVFLLYAFLNDRKTILNEPFAKRFAVMILLFELIISPVAYPMLAERSDVSYTSSSRGVWFSSDLLGFFIPSSLHPVFGSHTAGIYKKFTGNIFETTNYAGITVLILASYSVIRLRRKAVFWAVCSLIFFILALGPILHVNGNVLIRMPGINLGTVIEKLGMNLPDRPYEFLNNQTPAEALNNNIVIPLPSLIFQYIPFFNAMRAHGRFGVLVTLSLAMLSAFGLKLFLKNKNNRNILLILISGIIIFESIAIPFALLNTEIPKFYKNISSENGNYTILEVPFNPKVMYYQTLHEKKLIYGYVSRTPFNVREFIDNTPLVHELSLNSLPYQTNQIWYGKPAINVNDPHLIENGLKILKEYDIKYVIVHKDALEPQVFENVSALLKNIFKREPAAYEKDNILVYEVR